MGNQWNASLQLIHLQKYIHLQYCTCSSTPESTCCCCDLLLLWITSFLTALPRSETPCILSLWGRGACRLKCWSLWLDIGRILVCSIQFTIFDFVYLVKSDFFYITSLICVNDALFAFMLCVSVYYPYYCCLLFILLLQKCEFCGEQFNLPLPEIRNNR